MTEQVPPPSPAGPFTTTMTPPASQTDLHVGGGGVSWAPSCETHCAASIILYSLMHLSVPLL